MAVTFTIDIPVIMQVSIESELALASGFQSVLEAWGSNHEAYIRARTRNSDLTAQAGDMALMVTEVGG